MCFFYILYLGYCRYHPLHSPAHNHQYLWHNRMRLKSQTALVWKSQQGPSFHLLFILPPKYLFNASCFPLFPLLFALDQASLSLTWTSASNWFPDLHHHTFLIHHSHTCQSDFSKMQTSLFLLKLFTDSLLAMLHLSSSASCKTFQTPVLASFLS